MTMSIWIKICANTTLEDAQLAADLGADAVGFIFAPSKRCMTADQVAAIVPHLPREVEKIGVFVDTPFDEIARTVDATGLTGVQLQFDAPPELPAQLRARYGPGLRIVRVVHFAAEGPAPSLDPIDSDPNIDAVQVDSMTASARGGTGQTYDWSLAATAIFQNANARKCIAAGGLTPENVAEAIRILKPWGVDVASGVEAGPGRKDAKKVRAFIECARLAHGDHLQRE